MAGVVASVAVSFVWKLWSSRRIDKQYAQGKATADIVVHRIRLGDNAQDRASPAKAVATKSVYVGSERTDQDRSAPSMLGAAGPIRGSGKPLARKDLATRLDQLIDVAGSATLLAASSLAACHAVACIVALPVQTARPECLPAVRQGGRAAHGVRESHRAG
jgi:hypothetical protein